MVGGGSERGGAGRTVEAVVKELRAVVFPAVRVLNLLAVLIHQVRVVEVAALAALGIGVPGGEEAREKGGARQLLFLLLFLLFLLLLFTAVPASRARLRAAAASRRVFSHPLSQVLSPRHESAGMHGAKSQQ